MNECEMAHHLANVFNQCKDTAAMFAITNHIATTMKHDFVLCIDKKGNNWSKAFSVESPDWDMEDYFMNECPVASECHFKMKVYA